MSKPRMIALVLVLTVFAAAGLAYFIQGGSTSPSNPQAASNTSSSGNSSDQPASAGSDAGLSSEPSSNPTARVQQQPANSTTIGQAAAVSSSSSDFSSSRDFKESSGTSSISPALQALYGEGPVQPVSGNANPQVASVVEAARTGQYPERLSPWIIPVSFDKAAYQQDPRAYLDIVEPGRVYATAEPSKDVPVLKPAGRRFFHIKQNETIELAVRSLPGAPVTFTSFDMGAFENGVTSMSVAADDRGVARVRFIAVAGTIADVSILAGSPLASGQVKFTVSIESPMAGTAKVPDGS